MHGIRAGHTATLLPDGMVLVAGGVDSLHITGLDILASAELYDPSRRSWTATAGLVEARAYQTATLLPDGRVLVTGGFNFSASPGVLGSAELYDPGSGSWTATGNMVGGRAAHTATLLPDGRVLVAGGTSTAGSDPIASAELYDPGSGSWTAAGSMIGARSGQTATLLPDGRVLVAGGTSTAGSDPIASAELYDPGSGSWTAVGSMIEVRQFQTATLLPDGRVLVAGGNGGGGELASAELASAELYDPSSGSWTAAGSMIEARQFQTATLLPDGSVLVAGGGPSGGYEAWASAELYGQDDKPSLRRSRAGAQRTGSPAT